MQHKVCNMFRQQVMVQCSLTTNKVVSSPSAHAMKHARTAKGILWVAVAPAGPDQHI